MPRAKLRVKREGFTAKRGKTTYRVKPATFLIKDRGKLGRTPKEERWYKPSVHTGWEKGMPASKRRAKVLRAHKGDYLASARAMQSLSNVTVDSATKRLAGVDARYFFREHAKRKRS